ncbi:MAG: dipeptidase [Roseburia sp.]|nr:dipeptidase [Roseburia sp.]MCM1097970.1 dipeptidase [Ruminococcus flavefaciens]
MRVVDMHCDTISRLLELQEEGRAESLRENRGHLDLLRMRRGDYLLQNFALFVEMGSAGDPWEKVCALHRLYREEMEKNSDLIAPVLCFSDIEKNRAAGKLSAMLTVEEGGVCKGEVEKLRTLYDMGVRMLTLTWNYPNELGSPNRDRELGVKFREARKKLAECAEGTPEYQERRAELGGVYRELSHVPNVEDGLTERGREFVAEMERLRMIPDVSHLSDAGFYDVLETTKKPFAASHSDAREVCPNVRNMTDDMIRRLSLRGGVMGLNYCADFLEEAPLGQENPGTIAAIVRHAEHIVKVGGIEVLGLGSDFDGIDTHRELPGAQSMELLWDALRKAGFSEDSLDRIFYKNVLRVYRDTLG